jgi:hypothetical protein
MYSLASSNEREPKENENAKKSIEKLLRFLIAKENANRVANFGPFFFFIFFLSFKYEVMGRLASGKGYGVQCRYR